MLGEKYSYSAWAYAPVYVGPPLRRTKGTVVIIGSGICLGSSTYRQLIASLNKDAAVILKVGSFTLVGIGSVYTRARHYSTDTYKRRLIWTIVYQKYHNTLVEQNWTSQGLARRVDGVRHRTQHEWREVHIRSAAKRSLKITIATYLSTTYTHQVHVSDALLDRSNN